ncbi:colorectal cancer-associated protein 2 [Cyanistes caeruleus]|uniref:colorectal cancer-associated protein 2 n=1 Tax=Cyanistes caeruleus TaxID=156563 RepID=UPI000CDA8D77|nr:colorectal cancer-associated protein 2 [Cyanistes caeruleus]
MLGLIVLSLKTCWICCLPQDSPSLQSVLPQILPGKPKVYQGVRVKITVKELLQQRRARQAATSSAVSKNIVVFALYLLFVSWGSSSGIQFAESVSPPHPEPFEAEPIPPVPSCCPSWQFSSCLSCEESPGYLEQLIDSCLQEPPSEPAFSALQPSSHYTPDTFQPVQLCFNQGLVSFGSQGSSHRCPQRERESHPGGRTAAVWESGSLDTKPYSCPVEEWPCHPPCPFPSPACCCTACGPQTMDSRGQHCFPCPSTDCLEFLPALAEDFLRRDRSCDICYS